MNAVRRLLWWSMAYGSVVGLWMTAQVKADLYAVQPEVGDEAVVTLYYEPMSAAAANPRRADGRSPTDLTLVSGQGLDAPILAAH